MAVPRVLPDDQSLPSVCGDGTRQSVERDATAQRCIHLSKSGRTKQTLTDYLSLFVVALLSATLLPGGSELLFSALLLSADPMLSPLALWATATVGNTLGALLNWWLGGWLLHYQSRSWFPFKPDSLERSQRWFQRYGVWSLLLAWAPLVGDGLTFVAGVMRVGLGRFLVLVMLGKGARYAVLLWLVLTAASTLPRP